MLLSVSKVLVGLLLFVTITAKSKHRQYRQRVISDCKVADGYLLMQRDECKFSIKTSGCRGPCLSSAKPFSHRTGFASSCSCCAPIKSTIRETTVSCRGRRKVIRYPVAIECACRPCLNGWQYVSVFVWSFGVKKWFSSCEETRIKV